MTESQSKQEYAELALEWRTLLAVGQCLAHDLRSPLNTMVLQLELLGRVSELEEDEALETLERRRHVLRRETNRLHQGLERLLSMVAPPAKEDEWTANALLQELKALTSGLARQLKVDLQVSLPDSELVLGGRRRPVRSLLLALLVKELVALARMGTTLKLGVGGRAPGGPVCFTIERESSEQPAADQQENPPEGVLPGDPRVGDELVVRVLESSGGELERADDGSLRIRFPTGSGSGKGGKARCRAS